MSGSCCWRPVQPGPGGTALFRVTVDAPVARAGDRVHEVEAVRAVVVVVMRRPPAALVVDLDPHILPGADLGADGEPAAWRGGVAVYHRVGGEFRGNQHGVGDKGALFEHKHERGPYQADLLALSGVAAGENAPGSRCDSLCRHRNLAFTLRQSPRNRRLTTCLPLPSGAQPLSCTEQLRGGGLPALYRFSRIYRTA